MTEGGRSIDSLLTSLGTLLKLDRVTSQVATLVWVQLQLIAASVVMCVFQPDMPPFLHPRSTKDMCKVELEPCKSAPARKSDTRTEESLIGFQNKNITESRTHLTLRCGYSLCVCVCV